MPGKRAIALAPSLLTIIVRGCQGMAGVWPDFKPVTEDKGTHMPEIDEHTPAIRLYRNYAGGHNECAKAFPVLCTAAALQAGFAF